MRRCRPNTPNMFPCERRTNNEDADFIDAIAPQLWLVARTVTDPNTNPTLDGWPTLPVLFCVIPLFAQSALFLFALGAKGGIKMTLVLHNSRE
jgi:hypothetical protein